jgi:LmbE family N-acetylglucosaminyl deacetylase
MNPEPGTQRPTGTHWLVVAAHPDDDCMAAPLLLTERGPSDRVTILVMRLAGVGAPYDRPSWTPEEAIASRSRQMREAAELMNATLRWWQEPAPGNPEIVLSRENLEKMVTLLDEIKPDRVVTHWGDDHPDHVGTAELVVAGMQCLANPGAIPLFRCDHPTHELLGTLGFSPNYYVDISNPSILGGVLWARLVHRSLTNLLVMQRYLANFREHGRKAGVEYAVGFRRQRLGGGSHASTW